MDDFLHNLRSGKLKQPDRGRRDYTDYKGPQRRVGNDRRRPDYYAKVTTENFAMVKETLDALAMQQKRIADAVTSRERPEARIADALEAIMIMMGRRWGYEDLIAQRAASETVDVGENMGAGDDPTEEAGRFATASKLEDESKPELLGLISTLRDAGDSWEKIARHFDDQNIPTMSGKGKWRGPGVKKFWEANSPNA